MCGIVLKLRYLINTMHVEANLLIQNLCILNNGMNTRLNFTIYVLRTPIYYAMRQKYQQHET